MELLLPAGRSRSLALILGLLGPASSMSRMPAPASPLRGTVAAVRDLLDRVLPGSNSHFDLMLADSCGGTGTLSSSKAVAPSSGCYRLADAPGGRISVVATSASELTAGLGSYFREDCNMTIGWPRGGGSNIFIPSAWPAVGARRARTRIAPWSYFMNVCTHSYSLVWYSW
jgi:hypothetical protein